VKQENKGWTYANSDATELGFNNDDWWRRPFKFAIVRKIKIQNQVNLGDGIIVNPDWEFTKMPQQKTITPQDANVLTWLRKFKNMDQLVKDGQKIYEGE